MNARWVQIQQQSASLTSHSVSPTYEQWVAVDDDDEIIGTAGGDGQMWTASIGGHGSPLGPGKYGSFITLDAAKRRVQNWLHPQYTFGAPPANWVYRTNP